VTPSKKTKTTKTNTYDYFDENKDDEDEGYDEVGGNNGGDSSSRSNLRIVGTYIVDTTSFWSAVERDDDTIAILSYDGTVNVFDKTTCECVLTTSKCYPSYGLLKTKDNTTLISGTEDGLIEMRRLSDFQVVHSVHVGGFAVVLCGLGDGTIILHKPAKKELQRWDLKASTMVQSFNAVEPVVMSAIELNSDVIVSSSINYVSVWRVSTGERLHRLEQRGHVRTLLKLTDRHFASAGGDKTIRLWDEDGNNFAMYQTEKEVRWVGKRADGSIMAAEWNDGEGSHQTLITIRRP